MPNHFNLSKFAGSLALSLFCSSTWAQEVSQFQPVDQNRPEYSSEISILGIKPGMSAEEAKKLMDEHFGKETAYEEASLQVQSSNGNKVQYIIRPRIVTQWVGFNQRASSDPYETITTDLGTNVMSEQVVSVTRFLRQGSDANPAPNALIAQLEAEFGKASFVSVNEYRAFVFYAYDEQGLIDYSEGQEDYLSFDHFKQQNNDKTCLGYLPRSEYRFEFPRDEFQDIDCVMTYSVELDNDGLLFSLTDYELVRFNITETDKQINEALDVESEPSELKL